MGRKKKSLIEMSKKSIQSKKSRFKKSINGIEGQRINVANSTNLITHEYSSVNINDTPISSEDLHDNATHEQLTNTKTPENEESIIIKDMRVTEFVKSVFRKHAINFNMNRTCLTSILTDFHENLLPDLPKDSRTLLKTPRITKTRVVAPGEYCHYGLQDVLKKLFHKIQRQMC